MRHPLTLLLISLLILTLCTGCGQITRADYDAAHTEYDQYVTEYANPEGDTVVIHHGLNPAIGFDGNYDCPTGIRVATFRNGVLIKRHWQDDQPAQFIGLDFDKARH